MFGRKRYPGLRGILREMTAENRYSDAGTEPETASETAGTDGTLRSPEDIDRELAAEEAEALSEDAELIAEMLNGSTLETARDLAKTLLLNQGFEELSKKSILSRIINLYPQVQSLVNSFLFM